MWNTINMIELAMEQRRAQLRAAEEWRQYRGFVASRSNQQSGKLRLHHWWQIILPHRWLFTTRQALKLQEER